MNKRVLALICAVMMGLLTCGLALGEEAGETHIPYALGNLCVMVPVEWDESGYEFEEQESSTLETYSFSFEQDEQEDCEATLMSTGLETLLPAVLPDGGVTADMLPTQAIARYFAGMEQEMGKMTILENEEVNGTPVVFLTIEQEETWAAQAYLVNGDEVLSIGLEVPVALGEWALTQVRELAQSVYRIEES